MYLSQPKSKIPPSILHLQLLKDYSSPSPRAISIHTIPSSFPPSLESLVIYVESFNISSLPPTLKTLKLRNDFCYPLGVLPPSLTRL